MKLIVAGATGLVGSEIIRQSLQISAITQVIALARKPTHLEGNKNASKLKSVVISDYGEYPDNVKAELAGADACIWTVAVTPFKSWSMDFSEVNRVCHDCTLAGFKAIYEAGPARPFRFVYFSGDATPNDPNAAKPALLSAAEQMVRKFPREYQDVEVCIARPGLVTNSATWARAAMNFMFRVMNTLARVVPNITQEELAAAVLSQTIKGFDQEALSNAKLVRLGQAALQGPREIST